ELLRGPPPAGGPCRARRRRPAGLGPPDRPGRVQPAGGLEPLGLRSPRRRYSGPGRLFGLVAVSGTAPAWRRGNGLDGVQVRPGPAAETGNPEAGLQRRGPGRLLNSAAGAAALDRPSGRLAPSIQQQLFGVLAAEDTDQPAVGMRDQGTLKATRLHALYQLFQGDVGAVGAGTWFHDAAGRPSATRKPTTRPYPPCSPRRPRSRGFRAATRLVGSCLKPCRCSRG